MAKQSAAEKLTARIDADMAHIHSVANYVGGDSTEALRARIENDLARLTSMRDYVTSDGATTATAAKPKRTRGAGKRGLPKTTTPLSYAGQRRISSASPKGRSVESGRRPHVAGEETAR